MEQLLSLGSKIVGIFFLLVYAGGAIFVVIALIYLIFKRAKENKEEDFERRKF